MLLLSLLLYIVTTYYLRSIWWLPNYCGSAEQTQASSRRGWCFGWCLHTIRKEKTCILPMDPKFLKNYTCTFRWAIWINAWLQKDFFFDVPERYKQTSHCRKVYLSILVMHIDITHAILDLGLPENGVALSIYWDYHHFPHSNSHNSHNCG